MTRAPIAIMLAAATALAGCSKQNHTIVAGSADDENSAANATVELPPSIIDTKIYRCADNKVVYVDWLSDNKSANIRIDQAGPPTHLTAPEAGQPMTAEGGYELSGSATESTAKIAVPGHPSQSCKA